MAFFELFPVGSSVDLLAAIFAVMRPKSERPSKTCLQTATARFSIAARTASMISRGLKGLKKTPDICNSSVSRFCVAKIVDGLGAFLDQT